MWDNEMIAYKPTAQFRRCCRLDTGNTAELAHSAAGAVSLPTSDQLVHLVPNLSSCLLALMYIPCRTVEKTKSLPGFVLQTSHSALWLQYLSRDDTRSPPPCRRRRAPSVSRVRWALRKGRAALASRIIHQSSLTFSSASCLLEACVHIF